MCLYTNNKEGMIAKEPITCYKVYRKGEGGRMVSYYKEVKYVLKEGDEVVAEGDEVVGRDSLVPGWWKIGKGFIHALRFNFSLLEIGQEQFSLYGHIIKLIRKGLDDELDEAIGELMSVLDTLYWCEMEVPVGERYWTGNHNGICAKRMIFKREITPRKKSELLAAIVNESYYTRETPDIIEKLKSLMEKYKKEE